MLEKNTSKRLNKLAVQRFKSRSNQSNFSFQPGQRFLPRHHHKQGKCFSNNINNKINSYSVWRVEGGRPGGRGCNRNIIIMQQKPQCMRGSSSERERYRGNSLDWLQVSDLGPSKIVLPGESVNKKLLRVLQPKQQQQQQQWKKIRRENTYRKTTRTTATKQAKQQRQTAKSNATKAAALSWGQ